MWIISHVRTCVMCKILKSSMRTITTTSFKGLKCCSIWNKKWYVFVVVTVVVHRSTVFMNLKYLQLFALIFVILLLLLSSQLLFWSVFFSSLLCSLLCMPSTLLSLWNKTWRIVNVRQYQTIRRHIIIFIQKFRVTSLHRSIQPIVINELILSGDCVLLCLHWCI